MQTIANMPHADIKVQMPSGQVKTINLLRMLTQTIDAEMMAKYGWHLPGLNRLRPTVKKLRQEYELPPDVKTWKQAALTMRAFYTHLNIEAKRIRELQNGEAS